MNLVIYCKHPVRTPKLIEKANQKWNILALFTFGFGGYYFLTISSVPLVDPTGKQQMRVPGVP